MCNNNYYRYLWIGLGKSLFILNFFIKFIFGKCPNIIDLEPHHPHVNEKAVKTGKKRKKSE